MQEYLDWMGRSACRGQENLFHSPALEWEPDETESVTSVQQHHSDYHAAVEACKSICAQCPVLADCREWVQTTSLPIYGVVGGLSPEERPRDGILVTRELNDGAPQPIDADLVHALRSKGVPVASIARELRRPDRSIRRVLAQRNLGQVCASDPVNAPRCSTTSIPVNHTDSQHLLVEIPRHVINIPHPPHPDRFPSLPFQGRLQSLPSATRPFHPETASGIAGAIMDVLADGEPHTRDELLAAAIIVIPDDLAVREWAVGVSAATSDAAVRVMRARSTRIPPAERVARGAQRRASSYLAWMERTGGWVHRQSDGYIAAGDTLVTWHSYRATTAHSIGEQVPA